MEYKKALILLFINLMLSFCVKAPNDRIPLKFSTSYKVYQPMGTPTGQRVFLIHGGFNGSSQDWDVEPFLTFRLTLQKAGLQLITFDLPHMRDYHMKDGGLDYRVKFTEQLNFIYQKVELDLGSAKETIVGGFSLGGLHSMMAMVLTKDLFSRYFSILPVTDLAWMPEIRFDVPAFNPFNEVYSLKDFKGYITWGTADERVNFRLTKDLAEKLNDSVETHEYVGLDHSTTPEVAADTANWVIGN